MNQQRTFISAYKWNLLGKWGLRLIGIISTLILVRLLSPKDFGVVAIGLMVVGFFEVISSAGVTRYLILKEVVTKQEYHAAWTLNIFLKLFSVSLIILLSEPIANLLDAPEVEQVIILLSCIQILKAFKNVELIRKEKQMDFSYINKIQIYAKIAAVTVTIPFAFYYQNYVALIIGTLTDSISVCLLSYVFCPRKPAFNFHIKRKMLSFSSFILFRNILSYTRSQFDILIIGDQFGNAATGKFKVARDFVLMPKTEIIDPALQPLFVGVSRMELEQINEYSQRLLVYFVTILTPFSFFFYFNSTDFVSIIFGHDWLDAVSIVSLVGFLTIPLSLQALFLMLIDRRGFLKQSFSFDIIAISYLLIFVINFNPANLDDFVIGRITVALISFITITSITIYLLKLQIFPLLAFMLTPTTIIFSLSYFANFVTEELDQGSLISMVIYTLVFCFTFTVVCFAAFYSIKKHALTGSLNLLSNDVESVYRNIVTIIRTNIKKL